MVPRMFRWSRWLLLWVGVGGTGIACAPGLWDRWQGSGERFEGRLFQVALEFQKKGSSAVWLDDRGTSTRVAVCNVLHQKDGSIEFQIDPDTPALTCAEMRHLWTFRGRLGAHVLVGDLLDASGRPVGRMRALRIRDGGSGSATGGTERR